ncbi:MAG: hypothetical protein H0Z37_01390 [Firmicutes bacterium]|nr:hypothetical protein [Bacillota bacterium]
MAGRDQNTRNQQRFQKGRYQQQNRKAEDVEYAAEPGFQQQQQSRKQEREQRQQQAEQTFDEQ